MAGRRDGTFSISTQINFNTEKMRSIMCTTSDFHFFSFANFYICAQFIRAPDKKEEYLTRNTILSRVSRKKKYRSIKAI